MATRSLLLSSLLFSLVVFASAYPKEATSKSMEPEVSSVVVVEGVVYCQSCEYKGMSSLTDAKPLPAAKVSVTCKDDKNRVNYFGVFKADDKGYFFAQLDGLDSKKYYGNDDVIGACSVHLVSSPDPHCNLLTNVNYGITGASLRDEKKRITSANHYFNAVIYAAGPLAFRPAYCPKY